MNISRFITTLNQFVGEPFLTSRFTLINVTRRFIGVFAKVSEDNEHLLVKYNKISDKFPLVWLRDNCTCEICFHKTAQSRLINWRDFDVNVNVKTVEARGKNNIEINWHDDHKSIYSLDWLEKRSFTKARQETFLNDVYVPPKKFWDKDEFDDVMKIYEYESVMNDDRAFLNWLRDLAIYGVTLIKNARENKTECRKILEKVAFPRRTHYGEQFHVIARTGTNNAAYLTSPLQLHTDLPYYNYKPGVTILHCLVQTKNRGGENLLTDAFYVAEKLRRENKEIFDILSQIEVNWFDIGEEEGVPFHKIYLAPVISLDKYGDITSIRHSIPQRDSYFTIDINEVKPWYRALKVFIDDLYSSAARFKTQPGDVLAFDNTRLIHGRLGYEDTKDVKRLLLGNHLDWDEIYSKLRVLGKRFVK